MMKVDSYCTIPIWIYILSSFKFFKITLYFRLENLGFKKYNSKITILFWKCKYEMQKIHLEKENLKHKIWKLIPVKNFQNSEMYSENPNQKYILEKRFYLYLLLFKVIFIILQKHFLHSTYKLGAAQIDLVEKNLAMMKHIFFSHLHKICISKNTPLLFS